MYDPNGRTRISVETHHMNMDHSAYEGYEIAGKVDTVISRGTVVVVRRRVPRPPGPRPVPPRGLSDLPELLTEGADMDIGVVFQRDPPAARVVELAQQAEAAGFSHVWTFDSHLLWQEPYVIYSQILAATARVIVGPMVTNPGTRDWTVTASHLRHPQRDVRQPHRLRHRPGRLGAAHARLHADDARPSCASASQVIRELANGREVDYRGSELQLPVGRADAALEVWVAAYGPKALALTGEVGDGFILQLADPDIAAWMITAVRAAAEQAGRDPDVGQVLRRRAGLRRRRPGPPAGPDPLVRRHGRQPRRRHRRPLRRRPARCRRR